MGAKEQLLGLRIRRNIRSLSEEEIGNLREAFRLLYEDRQYQEFASILVQYGHTLQNDLLFLPWARAYFNEFELLLRTKVESVTLPYWDYTSKTSQEQGLPSTIGDPLIEEGESNPLYRAEWSQPLYTFRQTMPPPALAEAARLAEQGFALDNFVDFSASIWQADIFTHIWLGGSSRSTPTTAFDPVFWFSHCNLDRFWDQWQQKYDDFSVPPAVEEADLKPFTKEVDGTSQSLTGEDVLRTVELGYTYAE